MENDNSIVFSYAQDEKGRWVYVDDVPRGLKCGCFCPNCKEPLIARQGDIREHGFAHQSKDRQANLKMCYMVTMYKLAEHIVQRSKKIHAPSYYGIFPAKDLIFQEVTIDSHFEREDKQPDVIGITAENEKYLIEFSFDFKVQHKKPLDYKSLNCLEVNLSNQSFQSLEKFLLEPPDDEEKEKRWINNEYLFKNIEKVYRDKKKDVRIVKINECRTCQIKHNCCAVKNKDNNTIVISNNDDNYQLCKVQQYEKSLEEEKNRKKIEEERTKLREEMRRQRERDEQEYLREEWQAQLRKENEKQLQAQEIQEYLKDNAPQPNIYREGITCFDCRNVLPSNKNRKEARCGMVLSPPWEKSVHPDEAKRCNLFKKR